MDAKQYEEKFKARLVEEFGENPGYSDICALCDIQHMLQNAYHNTDLTEEQRKDCIRAAWIISDGMIHHGMDHKDWGDSLVDAVLNKGQLAEYDTAGLLLGVHDFFMREENKNIHGCWRLADDHPALQGGDQ